MSSYKRGTVEGSRVITFLIVYSTSYVNCMSHCAVALYFCGNLGLDIRNKSDSKVKY
jgi:hypothetical protein